MASTRDVAKTTTAAEEPTKGAAVKVSLMNHDFVLVYQSLLQKSVGIVAETKADT